MKRNIWQMQRDARRRQISDFCWTWSLIIIGFILACYLLKLVIEWRWR